jgi:hypothetical protein
VLGPRHLRLLAPLVTLALAAPLTAVSPATAASARKDPVRTVSYTQWDTGAQLRGGSLAGVRVQRGRLVLDAPVGTVRRGGRDYEVGRWTSPWVQALPFTEMVPSWAARTPAGTWIQVLVRGVTEGGTRGSWDTVARWAGGDTVVRRVSAGPQTDDVARLATDTWIANYGSMTAWQLRVVLHRPVGSTRSPAVDTVGAMTSRLPNVDAVTTSTPGPARGIVLDVPAYSQMTHAGEYPQYGGGGEAWCSPTSTAMVLAYYGRLPARRSYAWVRRDDQDRYVDHVARMTYDYRYRGTGNWAFNTAYAATRTGKAFVTRLRSLVDVERLVAAGIPVVASVRFGRGELAGAPISSTNGHLLVVVGFTSGGDVVVNDPAAPRNATVRRVYDRGQFEDAWLPRYPSGGGLVGSGGLGYVIHDAAHPLPARQGSTSW